MAILAADKARQVRLAQGNLAFAKVRLAGYTNFGAGTLAHTVYKGSLVVSDVSDTDGYFRAVPLCSTTNMASGDIFGGIAAEHQDVTSADTADGSVECTVHRNGVWPFAKGSLAITDIGAPAYAVDDDGNPTTTSTNNLWIGYIEDVDDTYAWINIEPAFMRANSAT